MKLRSSAWLIVACSFLLSALAAQGQATATAPYSFLVFAKSVAGQYTQPDSIAVLDGHVFVGYGNKVATDGSDGKSSTIVEYDMKGNVIKTFSVLGHNDGLRVNPRTKHLWAMENEDANPSLIIIDPEDGTQRTFSFGPTPHGGGYDDISFLGDDVFISASNPANNPNTAPAIVRAELHGGSVSVSQVLAANATANDIVTGNPVPLNLQDPDSMIVNPLGDLVLDSQADSELIILHHPGEEDQSAYHLGLTLAGAPVQVDDTVFATSSAGVLFVADRDGETVYTITRPLFAPGAAYTAAGSIVGALDLDTGIVTPVLTGTVSPHGMAFVGLRDDDRDCHDRR